MRFSKRKVLNSFEIDLGTAVFDRDSGRVFSKTGNELELRHQARQVLSVLAETPGKTVSRDRLIDEVWSGRSVAADSVAQCIAEIRRVLEDTDKRIVETVPREGYRLAPPVVTPESRWRYGRVQVVVSAALLVAAVSYFVLRPSVPTEPPVIAVLPFEDFSAAPNRGYVSDAVSESIITSLARYPQLTVISRRSSFQFRGTDLGVSEIAKKLGADFVLEGSQLFDGSVLQITAQLIDGHTEAHIWADEVEVPFDAMLKANRRISDKIANAVGVTVIDTSGARMTAGDVSALMIANAAQSRIMRNFSRENLQTNIEEQEVAIRDYPNSAWGYIGQALALRNGLRHGWIDGDEDEIRSRMNDLARRGVELDPNNFMAYHALGRVLMYNRDVEAAIGAFRRGAELNPSSTLPSVGLADGLVYVVKTDEALEVIARLERIDPLYGFGVQWTKGWALWQAGQCDRALEAFRSTPSMPTAANKVLAAIHHCLGDHPKAGAAMDAYLAENPDWTITKVREVNAGMWTAPGALDRWLAAMEASGMPHY